MASFQFQLTVPDEFADAVAVAFRHDTLEEETAGQVAEFCGLPAGSVTCDVTYDPTKDPNSEVYRR